MGGTLVVNDLIQAGQVRAVISEQQNIKTAINAFRLKYNCLPGDCYDAVTFFGGSSNNIWRGNGDRQIVGTAYNSNGGAAGGQRNEPQQAWRQLGLSGLIEGEFAGHGQHGYGPSHNVYYDGEYQNAYPTSYGKNAGWTISHSSSHWTTRWIEGNFLGLTGHSTNHPWGGATLLKVEDTHNIDVKIDDGRPGTGSVRSLNNETMNGETGRCQDSGHLTVLTPAQQAAASYNLDGTGNSCSVFFLLK